MEEEALDFVFDKPAKLVLNTIITDGLPKTVGVCAGLSSSFQPCQNVSMFPKKLDVEIGTLEVDYITGINGLSFSNMQIKCNVANNRSTDKYFFLNAAVSVSGLDFPVALHTFFGTPKEDVSLSTISISLTPRFRCVDSKSFSFELDPEDPKAFDVSDVSVDVFGLKFSVTDHIKSAISGALSKTYESPEMFMPVMKMLCPTASGVIVV